MTEVQYPECIWLCERMGGGGYPTGVISSQWEDETGLCRVKYIIAEVHSELVTKYMKMSKDYNDCIDARDAALRQLAQLDEEHNQQEATMVILRANLEAVIIRMQRAEALANRLARALRVIRVPGVNDQVDSALKEYDHALL